MREGIEIPYMNDTEICQVVDSLSQMQTADLVAIAGTAAGLIKARDEEILDTPFGRLLMALMVFRGYYEQVAKQND